MSDSKSKGPGDHESLLGDDSASEAYLALLLYIAMSEDEVPDCEHAEEARSLRGAWHSLGDSLEKSYGQAGLSPATERAIVERAFDIPLTDLRVELSVEETNWELFLAWSGVAAMLVIGVTVAMLWRSPNKPNVAVKDNPANIEQRLPPAPPLANDKIPLVKDLVEVQSLVDASLVDSSQDPAMQEVDDAIDAGLIADADPFSWEWDAVDARISATAESVAVLRHGWQGSSDPSSTLLNQMQELQSNLQEDL